MKFRVSEFVTPNPYGHRFSVEVGTEIKEKIWWIFFRKKVVWKTIYNEKENRDWTFNSFDDAVNLIQELKNQIPTYHYIL